MDTSLIAPIACLAITATSAVIITALHKANVGLAFRLTETKNQLKYAREVHSVHTADLDEKISIQRVEIDALRARLNTIKRITSGAMLRDPKTGKMSGRADW